MTWTLPKLIPVVYHPNDIKDPIRTDYWNELLKSRKFKNITDLYHARGRFLLHILKGQDKKTIMFIIRGN